MSGPSCCNRCLRRALLLGVLAPSIELASSTIPGRRTPELLALGNRKLARAVHPSRADALLEEAAAIDLGDYRGKLAAAGVWACCKHDPGHYPAALAGDRQSPAALLGRGDPALLSRLTLENTVTLVGSRRPSRTGSEVAHRLGAELGAAGLTVVSGMALGIDSRAHEGALGAGGLTVAVLGCGPDVVHPQTARGLYGRILDHGVVISELPLGVRPHRWSFPARNRIMAALGRMTVVIEAAARSGSLITAEMATDLGRDIGAVPGAVGLPVSEGANALLADGAVVVRGAEDVLEAMLGVGAAAVKRTPPALDPALAPVLDAVERGHGGPDAVAAASGLPVTAAIVALTRLELLGRIRSDERGRYAPRI